MGIFNLPFPLREMHIYDLSYVNFYSLFFSDPSEIIDQMF